MNMPADDYVCEQCGEEQKEPLIDCPQCELPCCDGCIAGRNVMCFACENEEEDE